MPLEIPTNYASHQTLDVQSNTILFDDFEEHSTPTFGLGSSIAPASCVSKHTEPGALLAQNPATQVQESRIPSARAESLPIFLPTIGLQPYLPLHFEALESTVEDACQRKDTHTRSQILTCPPPPLRVY